MLPSSVTSFHRQVNSERRFGMSSPSSCVGFSCVPVAAVAGVRASSPSSATATTTVSTCLSSGQTFSPDLQAQRAVLEHLFDRKLVEGDFWYVIVAEWLEQLKKFVGINSSRKYYGQRASSPPGPIVTRRDYAHTVDVVHEDAWRMLVQWYGLADGHKAMKLVVYKYARGPEIEHNINSFKIMLSNSPAEDFHIVRFSKMEKVGHIEYRTRQLYSIPQSQESRLWAKAEADAEWRPLFHRDKPIGVVLDMDSDFTRPVVALEITDCEGKWIGAPELIEPPQDSKVHSYLIENSMFDDVTTPWELDIHEQIDQIGKTLLEKLHGNFNVFVQRAKDHIEARECHIREQERQVCSRESVTERLSTRLEVKEHRLSEEILNCEEKIKEYESMRLDLERQFADKQEDMLKEQTEKETQLAKEKEEFETEKEKFQQELQRMSELGKVHESRIKLDIGGNQFTTSVLTLTRDPNSMLAAMFSGRHELKTESDGSYFIDRDGTHFRYVLNYLRDGCIKEGTLPQSETTWRELLTEAEFFQLGGLADFLKELISKKDVDD
uniref:DUSP domain-containing protein n=1 Tax=Arion vulgaris TaxID=1028688 RepID=A0A0B7AH64_9EUPU